MSCPNHPPQAFATAAPQFNPWLTAAGLRQEMGEGVAEFRG